MTTRSRSRSANVLELALLELRTVGSAIIAIPTRHVRFVETCWLAVSPAGSISVVRLVFPISVFGLVRLAGLVRIGIASLVAHVGLIRLSPHSPYRIGERRVCPTFPNCLDDGDVQQAGSTDDYEPGLDDSHLRSLWLLRIPITGIV